jgi:hypothetical protein
LRFQHKAQYKWKLWNAQLITIQDICWHNTMKLISHLRYTNTKLTSNRYKAENANLTKKEKHRPVRWLNTAEQSQYNFHSLWSIFKRVDTSNSDTYEESSGMWHCVGKVKLSL